MKKMPYHIGFLGGPTLGQCIFVSDEKRENIMQGNLFLKRTSKLFDKRWNQYLQILYLSIFSFHT